VIAAALMASNKSNYSFDVEIKKFGDKIFIDKRIDEEDEVHNIIHDNILDYDTVCETSFDHQPFDDENIDGIWPLMKEAKKINNTFLHNALSSDLTKIKRLEDENPFIEDESQVATRIGYHYNIWKIQEAD
jgi:translation initiation factor 3 subunit D